MLKRLSPEQFDRVFRLMEQSFPTDEHRPYEEQKALLSNPVYRLYTLTDEKNGAILAFLAAWEFEPFVFVEHFAVDPARRNGGTGSRILAELLAQTEKTVVLEVEPPETELTIRRIGFYERNGFFLNRYPYTQPAISKGRNPVPLLIMTSGQPVSHAEFENIRDLLYREVYGL